jgi:hypothetical protein
MKACPDPIVVVQRARPPVAYASNNIPFTFAAYPELVIRCLRLLARDNLHIGAYVLVVLFD